MMSGEGGWTDTTGGRTRRNVRASSFVVSATDLSSVVPPGPLAYWTPPRTGVDGWVDIEVRVLGGLEIANTSGDVLAVRGLGARLLLALAVDGGAAVADHDLLDRMWPAGPPNQAIASVRNQVARMRRLLGAGVIERTARGYRLNGV